MPLILGQCLEGFFTECAI